MVAQSRPVKETQMDDEIQLISDGEGLAVVGEPSAVERFLVAEGLAAQDLGISRLGSTLNTGSAVLQAGSEITASSGRWMKLTEESAKVAKKYPLVKNAKTGTSYATAKAKDGPSFVKNLEFVKGPGALATNPALLAGAAGLMAQLAMQQTMDEITDYLAAIDEKVDDILRAQKDAVMADMIGVDLVIEEAMTIRDQVGRVSEVTWSKVQANATTIARTQAYALRQLDGLAEKLENKTDIGGLAKTANAAESQVQEWLAVLARCFQLQDALGILELDRVLDASPEELDKHRLGLRTARQHRLGLITQSTERLLSRIVAAAGVANAKVLTHPAKAPAIVRSSNHVSASVVAFEERLGIESTRESAEARRWKQAAAQVRDDTLDASAEGLDAAKRFGRESLVRAKTVKDKLPGRRRRT